MTDPVQARRAHGKWTGQKRKEAFAAYLFLLPWIIGLLVFLLIPIGMAAYSAFTRWVLIDPPPRWIGLANFRQMFTEDRYFGWSLGVTLKYMAMTLIPFMILGLALSILLNQKLQGMNFFRTVFYIPSVVSGVAVTLLWISLLDPDLGALNTMLRSIGVADPPNWVSSPTWALPSVALMSLWGIGGGAIIYLAGLQNIPPHLYEAAEIDGANAWTRFWRITLPMLSPTIFFVLITGIIGSFQVFTPAYIMGGTSRFGAGSRYLRFYLLHLYVSGFQQGRLGYASALAWVLFFISAVTVIIVYSFSERWVYYEEEGEGTS
jgi:multiple sugar transport system permease protein